MSKEDELEKMKKKIAAGFQLPVEYLEPTLTGFASVLLEMGEEASKMFEDQKRIEPKVETDGRTVWVNAPVCLGRFCPLSGEVLSPDQRQVPPDWKEWKELMMREHGFLVEDKYQPGWSKK